MTIPTLTCDHCESEIDVAKDPRCVVYDPSGSTDVICEGCRQHAWDHRQYVLEVQKVNRSTDRDIDEAFRIKRGWRA